jgi:hypothetical protein
MKPRAKSCHVVRTGTLGHCLWGAILGIPMIPLCSEACPGIQPQLASEEPEAAAVDSIDPRLRPLLRLKKNTQ